MTFNTYGDKANPGLLLIPGLGVSYEILLPLIDILKDQFHIVAAGESKALQSRKFRRFGS